MVGTDRTCVPCGEHSASSALYPMLDDDFKSYGTHQPDDQRQPICSLKSHRGDVAMENRLYPKGFARL